MDSHRASTSSGHITLKRAASTHFEDGAADRHKRLRTTSPVHDDDEEADFDTDGFDDDDDELMLTSDNAVGGPDADMNQRAVAGPVLTTTPTPTTAHAPAAGPLLDDLSDELNCGCCSALCYHVRMCNSC
jgi:E3 ubiquitin-protein ligase CHFR